AVGAAGAAMARRRRQQEYEPMAGFDESLYAESKYGERSAKQKVGSGAASVADTLSARAGRPADSLHERSAGMQEKESGQQRESGPARTPSGPGMSGPGPVGTPGSMMSASSQPPMSTPRERLGDPALDFPDER